MATSSKPPDYFCSIASIAANEPILGSAPRADVWFLLEYDGRWGSKAFNESDLSAEIKSHFNQSLENIPNSRLLIIKRDETERSKGVHFFASLSGASEQALYKFILPDYSALLDIDLTALAAGDELYRDSRINEPLFALCTNGLRDQCCAKYGLPAFLELKQTHPHMLWQSSHHGGHRFGPNLLALPHGLSYGRANAEAATNIIEAHRSGRMYLPNLRGRTSYTAPMQAAEILLRQRLKDDAILSLQFSHIDEDTGDEWTVLFQDRQQDTTYRVRLARQESNTSIFASCVGDKQVRLSEFVLLDIQ